MNTVVAVDNASIERLSAMARGMGISVDYLPKWISYTLNHDANEFAEYVRTYWISGQRIKVETGETFDTLGPFVPSRKKRRSSTDEIYYSVRPGVGVPGNLNFHGRWAKPAYKQFGHEFMRPAFRAFTAGDKVQKDVERNIETGLQWALNGARK